MIARVWTVEELDQVHPLPKGWVWRVRAGGLRAVRTGMVLRTVCVGENGLTTVGDMSDTHETPPEVALAVILASKGLDSNEALAAAMGKRAHRAEMKAEQSGPCTEDEMMWCVRQETWARAAAWLRRGTVKP